MKPTHPHRLRGTAALSVVVLLVACWPCPAPADEAKGPITLEATHVELGKRVTLEEALQQIEEQTGNRLLDFREQFGQEVEETTVEPNPREGEFWAVVDALLDATWLDLYPYSGEDALAVVQQPEGVCPRSGRAVYAGPFRLDVRNVFAHTDLRSLDPGKLQVELEVSWEPRITPLALSQHIGALSIVADDDTWIRPEPDIEVLELDVQSGSHATEMNIPLELPPRSVGAIASLKGQLAVLFPQRKHDFRFTGLDQAEQKPQTEGGITVAIDGVRRNQELWEVRMRLKIESDDPRLMGHIAWAMQNLVYLEDAQGEKIDHAGFETTAMSPNEVGLAYFFDAPEPIESYTWVCRSPVDVALVPVEFEIRDIPLP